MEIIENRNKNYSDFDFVIFDFISPLDANETNFNFLDKIGRAVRGSDVEVDGIKYEIVNYEVGKGGTPHRFHLGFGVNKKE